MVYLVLQYSAGWALEHDSLFVSAMVPQLNYEPDPKMGDYRYPLMIKFMVALPSMCVCMCIYHTLGEAEGSRTIGGTSRKTSAQCRRTSVNLKKFNHINQNSFTSKQC